MRLRDELSMSIWYGEGPGDGVGVSVVTVAPLGVDAVGRDEICDTCATIRSRDDSLPMA